MSTFNVESDLLRTLLHSALELSVLIEAAIIAQDHLPPTGTLSGTVLLFLSHRWRKVMHRTQEIIKDEVVTQNNQGFHEALRRFWADYLPSRPSGRCSSKLEALLGLCRLETRALCTRFSHQKQRIILLALPGHPSRPESSYSDFAPVPRTKEEVSCHYLSNSTATTLGRPTGKRASRRFSA